VRSRTSKEGFFQFTNVEPGRYRLELSSAGHPTRYLSVEVAENAEVHLSQIQLMAFVRVQVVIDPPLSPTGGRWNVTIRPDERSDAKDAGTTAAATPDGKATFVRVPPGGLEVIVGAREGERLAYIHEAVTEDRRIDVSIPLVTVKGKVRRGSSPLPKAGVTIETGEGDAARFETDEKGSFLGTMRRPDPLDPTIALQVLESGQDTPRVMSYELRDPTADPLDLDVDLGGARVWGTVIDPRGVRAADADVSAEADNLSYHARAKTNSDGEFDFLGVPPGKVLLRATHPQGSSPKVGVVVSDDQPSSPLILELSPWQDLTGIVLSSVGAPVAGAQLKILTDTAERKMATTNEKGEFSARVSTSSSLSVVTVFAPSQLLWSTCIAIPRDDRAVLRMPPLPGGSLSLVKYKNESQPQTSPPLQPFLVTETGGLLSNSDLVSWRRAMTGQPGSSIDVPGVASQSYGLVWQPYDMSLLVSAACSGQLSVVAQWGYLPPGGELRIDTARPK